MLNLTKRRVQQIIKEEINAALNKETLKEGLEQSLQSAMKRKRELEKELKRLNLDKNKLLKQLRVFRKWSVEQTEQAPGRAGQTGEHAAAKPVIKGFEKRHQKFLAAIERKRKSIEEEEMDIADLKAQLERRFRAAASSSPGRTAGEPTVYVDPSAEGSCGEGYQWNEETEDCDRVPTTGKVTGTIPVSSQKVPHKPAPEKKTKKKDRTGCGRRSPRFLRKYKRYAKLIGTTSKNFDKFYEQLFDNGVIDRLRGCWSMFIVPGFKLSGRGFKKDYIFGPAHKIAYDALTGAPKPGEKKRKWKGTTKHGSAGARTPAYDMWDWD